MEPTVEQPKPVSEPTQPEIEEVADPETGETAYYSAAANEYWDPRKHANPPSLTKSGSFRARRGGPLIEDPKQAQRSDTKDSKQDQLDDVGDGMNEMPYDDGEPAVEL